MTNVLKSKIAKAGLGLLVAGSLIASAASVAGAMTTAEAQALVAALGLTGTQAQMVLALATPATTGGNCYQFTTALSVGSRGASVTALQNALGVSPATGYFGAITRAAVMSYQASHGLSQVGLVGPATRAALNAGCTSGGVVVTPPVQTGAVNAMLATNNPGSGTLVAGQATADLAHFTFNGNGTVTNVSLMRTGVSSNDTLVNVYLYDGGMRLTDAASVNTNGTISFNNPSGLFMVSGTKTISVRADIKSGTSGQTVGVALTSFTAGGVTTTVNLMGNLMSVALASDLAKAVMTTTNTVVGTPTVDAGTSNYTVWGATLTTTQRTTLLKGANFRVIGSIESGALQNARLVVDGTQVGSAVASVMANGNLGFDLSGAPVTLTTGAHTLEVRADIVGGANRSFYVSLQNASDLMIEDSQYHVNVTLLNNVDGTAFSMNSGVSIGINSGTLSLAKDLTFNTTTVTSGASNVTIGRYTVKAYGEAVKVMQVKVDIDLGTGSAGLQNVGVFVNGGQVGSSQSTADNDDQLTFNLGSSLIVPAGQTVTVEVRADMINTASASYTGTVATQVTIPVGQAQGQTSYALYPTGSALSSAVTTVTSSAASASISQASGFSEGAVGLNASNAQVGSYVISAGTTEGLRVTNLAVGITLADGAATTGPVELSDIANLRATVLVGGQTINLGPVNPQSANNFSTDFTIAAGGTATVNVYMDVTNATSGETIETTLKATARGASSNVILTTGTGISSALTGQEMTVGSGSIVGAAGVTIVTTNATSARYVIGGTAVEPAIRYNVKPTDGAVTIEELTFTIGGTTNAITSLSVTGTSGGTACSAPVTGSTVTLTGCSITVPYTLAGTDLIVTPTIHAVGIGFNSGSSVTGTVDLTTVKYNDGTSSTTADLDGADDADDLIDVSASNAIRPVASMPTLTLTGVNTLLTAGTVKVGSVMVSASSTGPVKVNALPVTFTLTGGATLDGATTTNVLVLKEGGVTIGSTDNVTTDATSGAGVISLTDSVIVNAGSSRTFDIYLVVKAGTVADGDDAAQISLAPSSSFTWDDLNGGGTNLVGTYLLNYPTSTVTVFSY